MVSTLHLAFLLFTVDASREVQRLRSSIDRLNTLKLLLNAEQVVLHTKPISLHALLFISDSRSMCISINRGLQ